MTCGVYFYGLVEDCIVSLKLVFSAPLYVLTICLEAVDKRALERAATKAALAKGWTLEGWRQKRLGEDDKTAADIAMAYEPHEPPSGITPIDTKAAKAP